MESETSSRSGLSIAQESARTQDAEWLLRSAEAELTARYPDYVPTPLQPEDVEQANAALFVARIADAAVGSLAVLPWNNDGVVQPNSAELKRLWVSPSARGLGIAKTLLHEAERWASRAGYTLLVLECGIAQPEAMQLYARCGYQRIRCWGSYGDDPISVCYKKMLSPE